MGKHAVLILEDGSIFHGKTITSQTHQAVGEVVFNTSMTGYQEILTDPSYSHQLVTLTYPHIGNTGTNNDDEESYKIYARGLIVRDISLISSNYRSLSTLPEYLKKHKIVIITDIDTRKLTNLLRIKGSQKGCIITGNDIDYKSSIKLMNNFVGLNGLDLAKKVSTKKKYTWKRQNVCFKKTNNIAEKKKPISFFHVVVYDFGVKHSILRTLTKKNCNLTIVPATTTAKDALNLAPDGIFLSNGPGDPRPCTYAIHAIKFFLKINIPIFGICLGHQLLALSSGATITKMKFGHHGANHPVQNLKTKRVMITSQNHGFTVDINNLPKNLKITHKSLFDNSLQGIFRTDKLAFGFQGHPEAGPGPHDAISLFDSFITFMSIYQTNKFKKR